MALGWRYAGGEWVGDGRKAEWHGLPPSPCHGGGETKWRKRKDVEVLDAIPYCIDEREGEWAAPRRG